MQALLIGCGKMGGALISQWVKAPNMSFTIVDPGLTEPLPGTRLETEPANLNSQRFDIVIVAIKPQLVDTILPLYKDLLEKSGVLVSIAAGCSVERLQAAMENVPVIRVMPNLPCEIGKGVSGLFFSSEVNEQHRSSIEALMTLTGSVVWVENEDDLDKITAIAGSGPGYVFEIARAYVDAAIELGFSQTEARALVLGTMAGTIEMAQEADQSLETLRNNVTSKNGTTQAGLDALNGDQSLSRLLKAAAQSAYKRAIEMR